MRWLNQSGHVDGPPPASARWPHLLLVLSFTALVGSVLAGLFNSYRNMLDREGESAANLADSMQVYVTEVLKQPLFAQPNPAWPHCAAPCAALKRPAL